MADHLVRGLAQKADVLLENFPVGTPARHGLDYAILSSLNERLIYVSCTGFGQSGPYAQKKGYDTVFQAMGGIMSLTGEKGGAPVKPGLPITPQTRTLPAEPCANCHRNFFPLGYALENFDPIGRWRTVDQAGPVDASGTFVDGTPIDGVVALRNVLLQHSDAFRTTVTEKLLDYAAGRPVNASRFTPETLVRARQILREMKPVRWSSLIAAVVRATPEPGR